LLPDLERAERIGEFWSYSQSRTVAELLIDAEEDKVLSGTHRNVAGRREAVAEGEVDGVRSTLRTKAGLSAILVLSASLAISVVLAPSAEARIRCFSKRPTIVGTARADVLVGTQGRDIIAGLGGDDTIKGLAGNDIICGFDGPDRIIAGSGRDRLSGDGGSDEVTGGPGNDDLIGWAGTDALNGGGGFDDLWGLSGNDAVNGGGGFDWVLYADAPGSVTVDLSADSGIGEGSDSLPGIEGVVGSRYDDVMTGDAGNNSFQADRGNDTIDGSGGVDFASFFLAPGPVTVDLPAGTATGEGTDAITGIENVSGSRDYADTITGDGVDNLLLGFGGNDTVSGADGDDGLDGGSGTDTLNGGNGADTCLNGESVVNCEVTSDVEGARLAAHGAASPHIPDQAPLSR
jgi:Ca2+-binding RTX toxin-like protein